MVHIAIKCDWELQQLDVNEAFIQVDLDYDVFMELPDGCGDKSDEIVKLNKSRWSHTSWTPVVVKA